MTNVTFTNLNRKIPARTLTRRASSFTSRNSCRKTRGRAPSAPSGPLALAQQPHDQGKLTTPDGHSCPERTHTGDPAGRRVPDTSRGTMPGNAQALLSHVAELSENPS